MIIYKVTNTLNGKIYIGQTINSLEERKAGHYREAKSIKKKSVYFHNALLKYPESIFVWEVLDQANSHAELDQKEQQYISQYKSNEKSYGYNLKAGGQLGGGSNAESTKKLIGKTSKEKWKNPELAEKMLAGLRKGTETVKAKAQTNYKKAICKCCGKEFEYRPMDTAGIKPTYCSKECYKKDLKEFTTRAMQKAAEVNKENQKVKDAQIKEKLDNWLKVHFKEFLPIKMNQLSDIFRKLSEISGLKDERSIMRLYHFTSRKKFVAELSKIYAEPV